MINEKKYSTIDVANQSKLIHEILLQKVINEIKEMPDTYEINEDIAKGIEFSLYVTHSDRVLWKSTKTRFMKVYEKELTQMIDNKDLTFEEVGLLTYISSKFTGYEDNIIKIDDEYASKQMLIDELMKITAGLPRSSNSHYERLLLSLEKKKAIISMKNPNNKRKKIYYISPLLFYKGQYMDKSVKEELITRLKELN